MALGAGQLAGPLAIPEREPRACERRVVASSPSASSAARRSPRRWRVEAHQLAAGADRRQHLGEPVCEQDQVHERRRLLERLQHAVGRLVAELVDPLDHEHAASGLERRLARGGDDRTVDVADEDLVGAARRDPGQVGMRAGARRARARSRDRVSRREQLGRDRPRGRALAGAAGPVEQIRVRRRAPASSAGDEDGAGVRMTFELGEQRLDPSRADRVGAERA